MDQARRCSSYYKLVKLSFLQDDVLNLGRPEIEPDHVDVESKNHFTFTSGPMVRSMACQGPGIRNSTSDRRLAICGRKLRNLAMEPLPGHPCRCRLHTILRSRQGDPCPSCPSPPPSLPRQPRTAPTVRPAARLRHTATMHPSAGCRPRYI